MASTTTFKIENKQFDAVWDAVYETVPLIHQIESVSGSVKWKDQQWGDTSAALMLVREEEDGTRHTLNIANMENHEPLEINFSFPSTSQEGFWGTPSPGDKLALWYNVGGPQCTLDISSLEISVKNKIVKPSVNFTMSNKNFGPVWHGVYEVVPLHYQIESVSGSVKWKDQQWGNTSAALMLVREEQDGTRHTLNIANMENHEPLEINFSFPSTSQEGFWGTPSPGDKLALWYNVGGPGCTLDISELVVSVFF